MTWTAQHTWVTGEVVTAAQLNIDLKQNLAHVASMTFGGTAISAITAGTELQAGTSNHATISANVDRTGATTYADVTGLSITPTISRNNWVAVFAWIRATQITAGNGTWQIAETSGDGTFQNHPTRDLAFGNSADFFIFGRLTGHTTGGTKTFAVQQKTSNSGGTVRSERGAIIAFAM